MPIESILFALYEGHVRKREAEKASQEQVSALRPRGLGSLVSFSRYNAFRALGVMARAEPA